MKLVGIVVLAGLCLWCGDACSSEIRLAADRIETLADPQNSSSEWVLIHFNLPTEINQARIVRATLWCSVDCPDGGGAFAEIHPMSIDWYSKEIPTSLTNSYDEKEAVSFQSGDCSSRLLRFEVSRWVRAWASGGKTNYGLLIRSITGAGSLRPVSTDELPAPELRITTME